MMRPRGTLSTISPFTNKIRCDKIFTSIDAR